MIYLDNAATTLQKPPQVARAMAAAQTVFQCRQTAAQLFSVPDPEQVVITCNATHALNLAIHSLLGEGDTVLISGYEHNAVTRPLHRIPNLTLKVAAAPPFDAEAILSAFEEQLTPEVRAVIVTHVSNVFGFVLPVEEIAELCREREVPLLVDASQSAGSLEVSLRGWGAAFVAMPGHKGLYGPQGTGLLLCDHPAQPLLAGGTGSESLLQEMPEFLPDRLEAGTANLPGIAGLLEGLRFVQGKGTKRIHAYEQELLLQLREGLGRLPGVEVFASPAPERQSAVLSFRVPGWDSEELGQRLAQRGIALRAGLHCAPLAHESAGTLETGTVRVSVSAFTQRRDIQGFLRELSLALSFSP